MAQVQVDELLRQLGSRKPGRAWSEFLRRYSAEILKVLHVLEVDADRRADGFLFVCEGLHGNRCRRLRRFDPRRGVSFEGWLRVLVKRLYIDWLRSELGRARPFRSLLDLSCLDHDVFKHAFQQRFTTDETFRILEPAYPGLTIHAVEESMERVAGRLTSRHQWLLAGRNPKVVSLSNPSGVEGVATGEPSPEQAAFRAEQGRRLASTLELLEDDERLLIQLRFEQELGLERIAGLMGLKNSQQADRRIRRTLEKLRRSWTGRASTSGRRDDVSVESDETRNVRSVRDR